MYESLQSLQKRQRQDGGKNDMAMSLRYAKRYFDENLHLMGRATTENQMMWNLNMGLASLCEALHQQAEENQETLLRIAAQLARPK